MPDEKPENYDGKPSAPTPPVATKAESVIGGIFFGVGILIMGLSGLCTVGMAIAVLPDEIKRSGSGDILGMLGVGALFGCIPFAIGLLLFWVGKKMIKK
jgi:hypothetical protein